MAAPTDSGSDAGSNPGPGWWNRTAMPTLVSCACGSSAISGYRRRVVPQARGHVLELGCGSGLNFPFYDPERVLSLAAVEPDPRMLQWATEQAAELRGVPVDFYQSGIETAALATDSIDTVVLTFVLCTIPDWRGALAEVARVLKPDGRVLFCEHGRAPDAGVARWQDRLEPIWKRLAGGCHLTRSADVQLAASGFVVEDLQARYTPRAPRFAGYVSWGSATPVAH